MTRYDGIHFHTLTQAHIYLREELVGQLSKRNSNEYVFTYFSEYAAKKNAISISKSLPVTTHEYVSKELHPFFDNLILEGWLLHQAEKQLHIDAKSRFAMLLAVGRNTIGAVSIVPLDHSGAEITPTIDDKSDDDKSDESVAKYNLSTPFSRYCCSCLMPSKNGDLHAKCLKLLWGTTRQLSIYLDPINPLQSFSRTIHGGSISGAQRKGLFRFDSRQGHLMPTATGSTHILKPEGDFPELPANEHVTMAIAHRLKFDTPPLALARVENLGLIYIIKRFDSTAAGKLLKEDAAQLLRVPSEEKYTLSNEQVAKVIETYTTKLDLNEFFRRLIFCFCTGNGDMHLKNWAILEYPKMNGSMHLSPCYDFLNTRLPLSQEQTDIGLPLLGKSRKLQGSYFRKFALTTLKLPPQFIDSVFAELPLWQTVIEEMIPRSALQPKSQERYLEIVTARLNDLLKQ